MPLQIFGQRAPDMLRHREIGFLRQLAQRRQERFRKKEVCPNHAHIIHTKHIRPLRCRPLPPRPEGRGFSGVLMNFDPITNAVAIAIQAAHRRYEHVQISRTITVTGNGTAVLRCMGAGGGGGANTGTGARGGNGGTVAIKTITVSAGDQLVITIPAGGSGSVTDGGAGGAGGTLSIVHYSTTILSTFTDHCAHQNSRETPDFRPGR